MPDSKTPEVALTLMDDEMRTRCLGIGCDPHCHACHKPIPVGTWYGRLKVREEMGVTLTAMACEDCTKKKAVPEPPEQRAARPINERGHGCYFIDGKMCA